MVRQKAKKLIRSVPGLDLLFDLRNGYPVKSWEEAKRRAGSYDDEEISLFRIEKAARGPIKRGPIKNEALVQALNAVKPRIVADFGGGPGEIARDVVAHCRWPVDVTVVENPTVVRLAHLYPHVTFAAEIPECDLLYSSCTLFYLDEPLTHLQRAFEHSRYVVLFKNSFSDRPLYRVTFMALHSMSAGVAPEGTRNRTIRMPFRTLARGEIFALADRCGFVPWFEREEEASHPWRSTVTGGALAFRRHGAPTEVR